MTVLCAFPYVYTNIVFDYRQIITLRSIVNPLLSPGTCFGKLLYALKRYWSIIHNIDTGHGDHCILH